MDPNKLAELTLLSKYIVETYAASPLARQHLAAEQDGKPTGLTLVSKVYPVDASGSSVDGHSVAHPVANYSYPRNDSAAAYTSDRPSTGKSGRSSVGSSVSSPGLTDDRTISELSFDDDYQCHTYTSRLWDGFWTQDALQRSMEKSITESRKDFPAPIPPLNPNRRQPHVDDQGQAWPLPDSAQWGRPMYPPPIRPMAPRTESPSVYSGRSEITRLSPETTSSDAASRGRPEPASRASSRPVRPPRPNGGFMVPNSYQTAVEHGHGGTVRSSALKTTGLVPPLAMKARALQPAAQQPARSHQEPTSGNGTSRPNLYNMTTSSCTKLPEPEVKAPSTRRPRHHKSMTDLLNRPLPPLPEPGPEPRSVFEDDSSDEDRDSERRRSFYRFHGRSSSDHHRRPSKAAASNTAAQRNRNLPQPPPPVPPKRQQPDCHCKKPSFSWKRQDTDVFGRMFGQRHA